MALLAILQLNCKKEDFYSSKINVTEKFFELPQNADPIIKRIVEDLKQKNALHPFVEEFVKKEGYPVWKYAKISIKTIPTYNITGSGEGDTLVSVPVVPDGAEYVKDVLKIKIDTELLYKLFVGENYASNGFDKDPNRTAPNADDIVKQIMAFEKEMYYTADSTVIYHIKDNRLFDYWPADSTKPQDFYISVKLTAEICPIEIVYISGWTIGGYVNGGAEPGSTTGGPGSGVTWIPIYSTMTINATCYDDDGEGGVWTTYPEGEPGGGGGTTNIPDSTTNTPNTLPDECGEGRNWVVYVIDTNTGEWKNPCTQEQPPIAWPDGPGEGNINLNNPCDVIDSLMTTNNYPLYYSTLRDSVSLNYEKGYLYWNPFSSSTNYVEVNGEQDSLSINMFPAIAIDGAVHNHNNDPRRLSIFSFDDFYSLYYWFKSGKIKDTKTFTFGMVSDSTAYTMMITDSTEFVNFGNKYLNDEKGVQLFKSVFYIAFGIKPNNPASENEKRFLKALQIFNPGISFFKANNTLTNFERVKLNSDGDTVPNPCN